MAKLKVEIVTPERRLATHEADEVIAPGAEGMFGVRPGHTAYLALLQPGPLTVKEGSQSVVYFVGGGFAEAGPRLVRVLADSAQPASEIDRAEAANRLAQAEQRLAAFEPSDPRAEEQRRVVLREKRRFELASR